MATRLWLPASGAPSISLPFDSGWVSQDADRVRALRARSGTALVSRSAAETSAVPVNVLIRQYVSDPLAPQALGGSVKAVVRCSESATAADMRSQMGVRLVSGLGAHKATLLELSTGPLVSEWATTLAARRFPAGTTGDGAPLAAARAATGDRLVVELGCRAHNTVTTSRSATMQFGDPRGEDLAEVETAQTSLAPWVEFSQTLEWLYLPVEHVRPEYTVRIVPDPETGSADRVAVTGTVPEGGRTVVIEDPEGAEEIGLTSGTATVFRQRSQPPLSTRAN